jgi:putative membrane protein
MSRSAWAAAAAIVVGLAIAAWALDTVGLARTFDALAGIGVGGLLLFLLAYGMVLIALGCAWAASGHAGRGRVRTFTWARMVREAANDLLPFSQLGGLIFGVKVLCDAGIAPSRAYAATVLDLTTEMASQVLLVLAGVAISITLVTHANTDPKLELGIWIGTVVLGLLCVLFLLLRGPVLALAEKMAKKMLPAAGALIAEVRAELALFESGRLAILPSFLWNAAAWLLSVFSVWVALLLLHNPLSFDKVLALEALISVVRSGAFLVPGGLGIQEAGYVLLAGIVGLDPGAALALALLKRARDVTIGVPTLLLWQAALIRGRKPAIGDVA